MDMDNPNIAEAVRRQREYNQVNFGIPQSSSSVSNFAAEEEYGTEDFYADEPSDTPIPGWSHTVRADLEDICADHQRNVERVAASMRLLDLLDRYDVQEAFDLAGELV